MLPTVLRPHLLAETAVPPRSTLGRTPTGNWTVTAGGELTVLDPGLLIAARFPLPAGGSGTHAVAPDTSCAALALPDRLVVVGPGGRTRWEVHHPAWGEGESGSAWITGAGTVWAVVPSADGPGAPDHWWMLDAGTGAVLQDFALDCHSTGSDPIPYPDGLLLGLSSADQAGQGFRVYAATLTGPPGVRRLPGTRRAPADVHPAGDRYLTTTQDHDAVAMHDLRDGTLLAHRSAAEVVGPDDFIDFHAAFVTRDRVVVRSVLEQRHIVLDGDHLEVLGPVEYPDGATRDVVLPAGDGRWVTADWLDGHVQLWSL